MTQDSDADYATNASNDLASNTEDSSASAASESEDGLNGGGCETLSPREFEKLFHSVTSIRSGT